MKKYYHEPDMCDFQHQVAGISKEMKFRLVELIEASQMGIVEFYQEIQSRVPSTYEDNGLVSYRFSSVLALLQTFRDALPKAIGKEVNLKDISNSAPHAKLLRQLRNSLVHDGYQPIGLWVDGRYFMGTNYVSHDQRGKSIRVDAPDVDVETFTLEYSSVYCAQLADLLEALPVDKKLKAPPRSYEWFQATFSHAALQRFPVNFPSRSEVPTHPVNEPAALDLAVKILREIADLCIGRLKELDSLPVIPYSR